MKLTVFILIFIAFPLLSEESPFEISLDSLINKATQTSDPHYLSRATARCSGLISLMHAIFVRDAPGTDFSHLEDESFLLFNASYKIDMKKLKSRGGEPSDNSDSIIKRLGKETNAHFSMYSKWFEKNLFEQGEYFGSSSLLQSEIKLCRQIASEIKS